MNTAKHWHNLHYLALFALLVAGLACNAPLGPTPATPTTTLTPTLDANATTPTPTQSLDATATPTLEPGITPTATPCNYNARFVEDVTVPDGTEFDGGETFDKTWEMSNTGCLAWPEGTQVTFLRGDQLSAPAAVNVQSTAVGGSANVTVSMTAPTDPGEYKGYWQLYAPGGIPFGPEFFVVIVVAEPTGSPDLKITSVVFSPMPIITDANVTVVATIKNEGDLNAPASKVAIQPEGTDAVNGDVPALAAGTSHDVTFTIKYGGPGTFGYVITSDSTNTVAESNEANNNKVGTVSVVKLAEFASGSGTVDADFCFDIDGGAQTGCGDADDDFWWEEVSATESYITPQNGVTIAVSGTSKPTFHACYAAALSASKINGSAGADNKIPTGTYLCLKTSDGHYAYVKIDTYGTTLSISYYVWSMTTS